MKKVKWMLASMVLLGIVACGSKVTSENLEKIETGMTKAEVIKILGSPSGEETSSALGMSGTTMIYKGGGKEIKIVLLNDKVMSKSGSFR